MHETLRHHMTAMAISTMLWGIIGDPHETLQNLNSKVTMKREDHATPCPNGLK